MKQRSFLPYLAVILGIILVLLFPFSVFAVEGEEGENGYSLNLSMAPSTGGSFQVTVGGEEKTGTSFRIKPGDEVNVTVVAAEGYTFYTWEIMEGVDIDPYSKTVRFTMPQENVRLHALMQDKRQGYSIVVEENIMGESDHQGKSYSAGEKVTLTAKPYDGFRFVRWIDDNSVLGLKAEELKNAGITFTMPEEDVYLSMEFEYISYRFQLKVQGEGKVEIEGKKPNDDGSYSCTVGEEIVFMATPGEGFAFAEWIGNHGVIFSETAKEITTVTCPASDFEITAKFSSTIKELTITSTQGGSVSPEEGVLRLGIESLFNLMAIPDAGYVFSHWECSSTKGKFANNKEEYTAFTMPDEDCTITAVFIRGGYRLTVTASAGGSVVGDEGNYEMGASVPLKAIPREGYAFSRWESSVPGVFSNAESVETLVAIPGRDLTVTAVFVLETARAPGSIGENPESTFPWFAVILMFFLSLGIISLIIIRERYSISYIYLIKKWITGLVKKQ